MNKFFEISTNEITLVSTETGYLIESFDQLDVFLFNNFPVEYHHLLAKPKRTRDSIEWHTSLDGEFQKVEFLSPEERDKMILLYNARTHEINNKCNALAASDDFDRRAWSEILMKVFNPDYLQLFSNGEDLVLVWGINTLKSKDYVQGFENYQHLIIPVSPLFNDSSIPDAEDYEMTDDYELGEDDILNDDVDDDQTEESSSTDSGINEESVEESENSEEPTVETHNTVENNDDEPTDIEESEPDDNGVGDGIGTTVNNSKKKKPAFYKALDAFEIFAKKYWWLIIIIIALLIFLLMRGCDKPISIADNLTEDEIDEVYDEIMPKKPRSRIIPIDTTDFIQDDNGITILSGYLNIAMVDNKEKFKRMTVELKWAYPGEEYQIVYYDEETERIQFGFPENDHEQMKQDIRSKLSDYQLLIWDETIFTHSKNTNDPFFNDQEKTWHYKDIQLDKAWDITDGDTSVYIAVVDDGFDLSHDEFKGKRILYPYNVITQNANVYGNEEINHGTHVAALATGTSDNNSGASGVAPNCTFIPVQISTGEPYFSLTSVIDGVLYAINHGADVINLSLGMEFGAEMSQKSPSELEAIVENTGQDQEEFWKSLFALADEKNVTIVMAAGNQNLIIGLDPMQRSTATLKVVATEESQSKAEFSNYCIGCFGQDGFVSAPGKNIWSAVPGNNYASMNGTSMASPIVAGAVALLKSKSPDLKNEQILTLIRETSKSLNDRSCPPLLQIEDLLKR